MEKDISCKCDKKVVVPILVSDKVDFKTKCIIRNKERHSINTQGKDITFVNIHAPNMGFPGSSAGKESACNARDPSLIPGSGKSLGEGTGCPLQYSCLENPIERGAWQAIEHGVAKSQTQLSN